MNEVQSKMVSAVRDQVELFRRQIAGIERASGADLRHFLRVARARLKEIEDKFLASDALAEPRDDAAMARWLGESLPMMMAVRGDITKAAIIFRDHGPNARLIP